MTHREMALKLAVARRARIEVQAQLMTARPLSGEVYDAALKWSEAVEICCDAEVKLIETLFEAGQ